MLINEEPSGEDRQARIEWLRPRVEARRAAEEDRQRRAYVKELLTSVEGIEFEDFSSSGLMLDPETAWRLAWGVETWLSGPDSRISEESPNHLVRDWLSAFGIRASLRGTFYVTFDYSVWAKIRADENPEWLGNLWEAIPREKEFILLNESETNLAFVLEEERYYACGELAIWA